MRCTIELLLVFAATFVSSEFIILPKNREDWITQVNCDYRTDGIYAVMCSKSYLVCIGNNATIKTCRDGRLFNVVSGFCEHPYMIYRECKHLEFFEHTLYQLPYVEFGQTLEWQCYQTNNGVEGMAECSQEYAICHERKPILMRCCENLFFDNETKKCVAKEKIYDCKSDRNDKFYKPSQTIEEQRKDLLMLRREIINN